MKNELKIETKQAYILANPKGLGDGVTISKIEIDTARFVEDSVQIVTKQGIQVTIAYNPELLKVLKSLEQAMHTTIDVPPVIVSTPDVPSAIEAPVVTPPVIEAPINA